jgi:hypothetical protein
MIALLCLIHYLARCAKGRGARVECKHRQKPTMATPLEDAVPADGIFAAANKQDFRQFLLELADYFSVRARIIEARHDFERGR